jgi:tetratricopeptide (TPR) repeat protein
MGSAMHLAPIVRRLLAGLPVVVCSLALLPVALGWELFSSSSAKDRAAANATRGTQGSNAARAGRGGPLFHGQELHWPSMPFSRAKQKPQPPMNQSLAGAPRGEPQRTHQVMSRFGTPNGPVARSPQGIGYNNPAAPMSARQMTARQSAAAGGQLPHVARGPGSFQVMPGANAMVHAGHQAFPSYGGVRPAAASLAQSPHLSPQPLARPLERDTGLQAGAPAANSALREPTLASAEPNPARSAAMASAPESPADRLIAQAHASSGTAQTEADYTQIIETCRRARASQPGPATARYASELASWAFNRRGQSRAEAGRHQEALADFDEAIRADSGRWRAVHNRGVLLAQDGQFERAFDDFTRTIQLNPDFAKAYSNRAALLMVAGDLETSLTDYRRAIELDPSLAVAHRGCGRANHLLRRLDEALNCYDEAVRLAPEDGYAVASRADLLTDLGRYAEAAAEYERAMQLDPQSCHACSSCAWLLATCPDASVRNPELAIERARQAIELSGQKSAVSYDTLAAAQANAGDFSAAIQTARQALQLASPEERGVYEARLAMYQHAKPYRIAPVGDVVQASYEAGSWEQGAGRF